MVDYPKDRRGCLNYLDPIYWGLMVSTVLIIVCLGRTKCLTSVTPHKSPFTQRVTVYLSVIFSTSSNFSEPEDGGVIWLGILEFRCGPVRDPDVPLHLWTESPPSFQPKIGCSKRWLQKGSGRMSYTYTTRTKLQDTSVLPNNPYVEYQYLKNT